MDTFALKHTCRHVSWLVRLLPHGACRAREGHVYLLPARVLCLRVSPGLCAPCGACLQCPTHRLRQNDLFRFKIFTTIAAPTDFVRSERLDARSNVVFSIAEHHLTRTHPHTQPGVPRVCSLPILVVLYKGATSALGLVVVGEQIYRKSGRSSHMYRMW